MTMTRMLDDLSPIQRASLLKTKKVSGGTTSLWMINRKSSRDITSPKVLSQAIQREQIIYLFFFMRVQYYGRFIYTCNITEMKCSSISQIFYFLCMCNLTKKKI